MPNRLSVFSGEQINVTKGVERLPRIDFYRRARRFELRFSAPLEMAAGRDLPRKAPRRNEIGARCEVRRVYRHRAKQRLDGWEFPGEKDPSHRRNSLFSRLRDWREPATRGSEIGTQ